MDHVKVRLSRHWLGLAGPVGTDIENPESPAPKYDRVPWSMASDADQKGRAMLCLSILWEDKIETQHCAWLNKKTNKNYVSLRTGMFR